ncbi:hypothetical protein HELRODRAFT_182173 [Helobdella robusta]|uniref:ShKT domain-containing protein n=1 Tax=Helobdella robusta TaxID=6412 RepID=T1FHV3_HELRO|nr:hypothetical protein HELRODRAFT_182173 [Helobdella robusta]ESN91201.1 hypothetical protein HELRODRAFT_182173 [Helobdella robusta]
MTDKCVHGDQTESINYNNAPLKCPDLKRQRGVCSNNPNMAKYCCRTCEEIQKEGPQGCREGDMNMYSNCDQLFAKNVFMCEQKQNQDGCCQSCFPFMREVNKCLKSGKSDAKYCGNRVRCDRGNCVYSENNLFTKGGHADRFSNCDDLVRGQKSACKDQLKEDCPLSCFKYGGYQ